MEGAKSTTGRRGARQRFVFPGRGGGRTVTTLGLDFDEHFLLSHHANHFTDVRSGLL